MQHQIFLFNAQLGSNNIIKQKKKEKEKHNMHKYSRAVRNQTAYDLPTTYIQCTTVSSTSDIPTPANPDMTQ